jgi:hypothetical protein
MQLKWWMHHTPLTWYEQDDQNKRLILRPFPEHSILQLLSSKDGSQRHYVWIIYDVCCRSYRLVHAYTKHVSHHFWSPLSNSICMHKGM